MYFNTINTNVAMNQVTSLYSNTSLDLVLNLKEETKEIIAQFNLFSAKHE